MTDFPIAVSFDEALALVRAVAARHRVETQLLATPRCHGRVLARDVVAPLALPPFDNSAMDGFAFGHPQSGPVASPLRLVGEQFAGRRVELHPGPGECVRITTGSPMPAGTDTVAIKENAELDGECVHIRGELAPGANVRRAGEDVRAGEPVLRAGDVLTPARVSLAAALGIATLDVARRPTVAVFTTGDELVEPGIALQPGEIYDSNRDLLTGLLRADGLEPTAWPRLPDDPRQVEIALRDAACAFDVVLTCGAVSAGEKDHIPSVLQRFGDVHFWKVRMKPGMPVLFGSLDQARVLGLPGNPVSVLATYLTLGRTLIDGLQGRAEPRPGWNARLLAPMEKSHPRREFVRGQLRSLDDGTLGVMPSDATGSHRLRAAADCDALIVVPEGPQHWPAGQVVQVLPYA